MDCFSISNCFR